VPPLIRGALHISITVNTASSSVNFNFLSEKMLHFCNQKTILSRQMLGLKWGLRISNLNFQFIYRFNLTTFVSIGNILKVFVVFIQSLTDF
jgi:hypothetical protein